MSSSKINRLIGELVHANRYYFRDLNAMAQAIATLEHPEAFASRLGAIIMRDHKDENPYMWSTTRWHFAFTQATAKQKAEAFLMTKGLWKE
jgi:hypothetical protein